jgi:hydrogenase nickel incorporation protein HypB
MEVKVLKNILNANDMMAEENRKLFASKGIFSLNVMASPGSGKTTLIMETIKRLKNEVAIGVIEGDTAGSLDAERISKENVPVVQINTGGGCHLEAQMVNSAAKAIPLDNIKLLIVENVGNLICPGEFELGVSKKVVLMSTPEGDNKPYKYPLMFKIADVVVVSKTDLMPYVNFKLNDFTKSVRSINQKAEIIPVSAQTGEGFDKWIEWLKKNLTNAL